MLFPLRCEIFGCHRGYPEEGIQRNAPLSFCSVLSFETEVFVHTLLYHWVYMLCTDVPVFACLQPWAHMRYFVLKRIGPPLPLGVLTPLAPRSHSPSPPLPPLSHPILPCPYHVTVRLRMHLSSSSLSTPSFVSNPFRISPLQKLPLCRRTLTRRSAPSGSSPTGVSTWSSCWT
jgi:hypothetical protein